MSSPARFSIKQSVTVNLLVVVLLVSGLFLYSHMTRELLPEIDLGIVTILTTHPGVLPETMEETITAKIERKIKDVEGIDEIRSWSLEGRSLILVKARAEVTDSDRFRNKLQTEVDKVTDLPDDEAREEPIVQAVDWWSLVSTIAISGDAGDAELRNLAKALEDRLEEIGEVGTIQVRGLRDPEVHVEVDRDRLHAHGLSLADVASVIRQKNVNMTAGSIKGSGEERGVRVNTKLASHPVEAIKRIVVAASSEGRSVTVGEIANVYETLEEEVTRARANRKRAITLAVSKRRGGNAITLSDLVREEVAKFQDRVRPGITVEVVEDNSTYIRDRITTMQTTGAMGLALVLLILGIFINHRLALMAALGIPIAFAGAVILMNMFGMTVNNISLFSMIIVLGMLVDDAIVISENIYRYMEKGLSPVQAAIRGTDEVKWPVITTIATTIAVFMPMLLMTGTMGKIMSEIPKVVTFCLIVSLIEALFVLPAHMAEFVKVPKKRKDRKPSVRDRVLRTVVRKYLGALRVCLRWRYTLVPLMMLLSVGMIVSTWLLTDMVLFASDDSDRFFITLRAPVDTSLEGMERYVERFEEAIDGLPNVKRDVSVMTAAIGSKMRKDGGIQYGKNIAQLQIHLVDPSQRDRVAKEIMEEIRSVTQPLGKRLGVAVEHDLMEGGPPVGRAVSVEVRGKDIMVLRRKAEEVKKFLAGLGGVKDITDDFEAGREEFTFRLYKEDDTKSQKSGITSAMISVEMRRAINGLVVTSIESGTEEIDVRVKFPERQVRLREDIEKIRVKNAKGQLIPIENLGRVGRGQGYAQINRRDGKRTITVSADVEMASVTSEEVNRKLRAAFRDGPGYAIALRGEHKDTQESMQSLAKAFVVGLLVVYLLLGALFRSYIQPLIVMIAIPLAFVGVAFGLLVTGDPRSLMAMIGTVALAGIVVNDSLILVNFINQARARGYSRWRAILMAGKLRFRPIILTSLTTIFGLMPLALGLVSGLEAWLSPMALALVWGLTFSTVLTLIIIPCLYTIVDDVAVYFGFGRFSKPELGAELTEPPPEAAGAGWDDIV